VRILIVTAGSRGDVAPFTGLGQRLQEAGHQVALAAHDTFAGLVRGCGLEYRPLPGDPRDLVRARTAAGSDGEARSGTVRFLEGLGEGIVAAAGQAADVLLTALGPAPLSRLAAEALGLPCLGTYLAPAVPTGEFALPGPPQSGGADPAANLAAGRELLAGARTSRMTGCFPRSQRWSTTPVPGPQERACGPACRPSRCRCSPTSRSGRIGSMAWALLRSRSISQS
jgi:sterol 3beta-glucosyltransferase